MLENNTQETKIKKRYVYHIIGSEKMTLEEETNEKLDVANAMVRYGGSFVAHLGQALLHADYNNVYRIKNAFPDYWKQYKEMGKQHKDNIVKTT